ncbi:MAG: c-type cytochrome [Ignavibacteria bacterium]
MIGEKDLINLELNKKLDVLLRGYGVLYILVLALMIALGWEYLNNLEYFTRIKFNAFPNQEIDTTKNDLPLIKGSVTPPVNLREQIIPTSERITKGKTLFEMNCVSCHGVEGRGDGVAGKNLNPPPRNFHQLTGWTNGPEFTKMYKTLQEGIVSRGMASYSNLSPEDRIALIHYIRTFAEYPKITDTEVKEVDRTYGLSSGIKQPNQIPISLAVEKMIVDISDKQYKIDSVVNLLRNDNSEAAKVIRQFSNDLNKFVISLFHYTRWNENETNFVNFITVDPKSKGVRPGVFITLTKPELLMVFNYLKQLI